MMVLRWWRRIRKTLQLLIRMRMPRRSGALPRRRFTHAVGGRFGRVLTACPRKRVCFQLVMSLGIFTWVVLSATNSVFPREDAMEQRVAMMQAHIHFLESLYQARQKEVLDLQTKLGVIPDDHVLTTSPEVSYLLRNLTGTKTVQGLKNLEIIKTPFVYQLLPHLLEEPYSLRPAFHMRSRRGFADIVIGIPTVHRDKENYLIVTLQHIIDGLTPDDLNSTLIIVFIGETDLEYVLQTARKIESAYPKQVKTGLIEVLSPSPHYYPNLEDISPTLGDSIKRFKWRTKQNLDTMYLMAYAQTKGTYYLMLEDDVVAKKDYMTDIKKFTAQISISQPHWFFIEYCPVGGIGKLFHSSDLLHFITYIQLFYKNLPIDWLLESYLADKVCTIYKTSKQCSKSKSAIRPKYKESLFLHIGLYSSLKGKIQKVKDPQFGPAPTFFPHSNPPLSRIRADIEEHSGYTLRKAYEGKGYFWGLKPRKGDVVEFWFEKPTSLERYIFRSGNVEHISDRFYDSVIEILPTQENSNFTVVGTFDEFGLAEGELKPEPLLAIRIKVQKDSLYWVILSEIELKSYMQGR